MNGITLLTFIGIVAAVGAKAPIITPFGSFAIGDYLYFTDSTPKTRQASVDYCRAQGAELGTIPNRALYNQIRLSITEIGTYWIDGIDKDSADRFVLDTSCTTSAMNLAGVPIDFGSRKSCLALQRGTTAANTRITTWDCTTNLKTLCAYSLKECTVTTTTSPKPEPESK